jgi:hypothetical protein
MKLDIKMQINYDCRKDNKMIDNIFDDVFAAMDAFMRYPFAGNEIGNNGLRGLIKIPHNLYTVKNDKGAIEK